MLVTFGEIMMRLSPPGHLRFFQARSFDMLYGGGLEETRKGTGEQEREADPEDSGR